MTVIVLQKRVSTAEQFTLETGSCLRWQHGPAAAATSWEGGSATLWEHATAWRRLPLSHSSCRSRLPSVFPPLDQTSSFSTSSCHAEGPCPAFSHGLLLADPRRPRAWLGCSTRYCPCSAASTQPFLQQCCSPATPAPPFAQLILPKFKPLPLFLLNSLLSSWALL